MAEQSSASPEQLMALMQGYASSAALKAGLDLELFTHIAHGVDTAAQLASAKHLGERATRILCDALAAMGVLSKSEGRYSLPPASAALLVKGSPAYMGAMAGIMVNPVMWNEAGRLTDVVKAGHTLLDVNAETPDNPFWQDFSRLSRQMAGMAGPALGEEAARLFTADGPRKILDIAAGSGLYGFNALKRFPNASLTSVDWPGVLALAAPTAERMGLKGRVEFRPGDIFNDDLGGGYDLVLAVNIYHHFSRDRCVELSRRLYDAAAPGAAVLVVDMVADEKRERNRFAAMFALTMLLWTRDGDTYTLSEYERMLNTAGFRNVVLAEVGGAGRPLQVIEARK